MKIKDVEELLSVSRSNIRFYEKQGLFTPCRRDNNYREYTEEDIEALKRIIILRKMGFTVDEIKAIMEGELPFSEAVENVKLRLEEEIEELKGSLELVRQVSKNHSSFDEIDVGKTWDKINNSEKAGEKFIDICKDYLKMELDSFDLLLKVIFFYDFKKSRRKYGIPIACLLLLTMCIARGIGRVVIRHESFWSGALYPFALFCACTLFITPLYLLRRKYPKVAGWIAMVFITLAGAFLAGIVLLVIFLLIRSVFT